MLCPAVVNLPTTAKSAFSFAALIEVERLLGRRCVRVLFSLFQQLVEFSFQNFLMTLVLIERLLEDFASACFLTLQFLHGNADVFNRSGPLVLHVTDDCLQLRIDLKHCFAAWTPHFDEVAIAFRHTVKS
jgi:hypothetical protein